ncbi:MAG: sialidase family protein [Bacteroidales bacterium]
MILGCKSGNKDEPGIESENPYQIEEGWKITSSGLWIRNNISELSNLPLGPFIRLTNNDIVTVGGGKSFVSSDEGYTWKEYPVFTQPDKYTIGEHALIRTSKGIIILAFYNTAEKANWNWQTDIHDSPGAILPTYAVRSLDGGKTWQNLQKLHDEWTGSIRDIIETVNGNIVFTSMMMQHSPGHHAVVTYTTKDDGVSWIRSNIIDLGGIGNHGGVMEATIEQLHDGRIWMLMRTNWGFFWEAFSEDDGLTWKDFKATNIDAGSAPGMLSRIQSGRLVLVWNRYYPEGKNEFPLTGGDNNWSEVPVSNHREELSIMFSDDDGLSWSKSSVTAKVTVISSITKTNNQISYPYLFEARPGVLWITTGQGNLRISLNEKDFI